MRTVVATPSRARPLASALAMSAGTLRARARRSALVLSRALVSDVSLARDAVVAARAATSPLARAPSTAGRAGVAGARVGSRHNRHGWPSWVAVARSRAG